MAEYIPAAPRLQSLKGTEVQHMDFGSTKAYFAVPRGP